MSKKISLITMGAGNVKALKKTLDSFKNVVSEIIYGDLILFDDDREIIEQYSKEYNFTSIKYPFNYIFKNGFSEILNDLASFTTNDLVLYMNTGEIIDGEERILGLLDYFEKDQFTCFAFDHATDPHTWYRMYDKNKMEWNGFIHEELVGDTPKQCPYYLFRMSDTEKDMDNPFKAKVMNDIKEIVYFNQYIRIVDHPEQKGVTNDYWLKFAKDNYQSMKDRLSKKGKRYQAFLEDNLSMFMQDIYFNPEFENEKHESSTLINFQGARKDIL